ncbi:unnamed protein product [Penicillium salamii]|uniref:Pentatricopeptide repeat protein n=1 Tax=Penicillium salamii TaxID=1612424 RepID=A0A9W4NFT2_9EURO|nr:unnamed protein product [Penicillium salamii]CAG8161814.1 unnamed protein product [Penicillium salamii]CAG8373575.1 unnamed protein product [Penicillium salamii]CAG8381371.1 unnamed protein product [Penicillium salamii]CAG8383237.1 unnamed protein product [Penicillium salamii]
MTLRLPGSLVNRALRSRLLSAQQCRAATAALNLPVTRSAIGAPRAAFSLSARTSEQPSRSQYTYNTRPFDEPGRPRSHQARSKKIKRNALTPGQREMLMAVASNSRTTQYDNETEIAESEALDAAAAQEDGQHNEQEEQESSPAEDASEKETAEEETNNDHTQQDFTPRVSQGPKITPTIVNMELRWLNDPRKMADRIDRILRSDQPALAAAIVRAGTKQGLNTTVAWNLLLQYCMEQGHPQAAFKFYNDMKKRGRRPKATTYTIMLKGFSAAPKSQSIVKTAASVYRSISAPNSGVDLSIIHTNAMLTVCHRHGDMDRLWKIAGDLPEEGHGAPDATTYTIILNAVQFAARRDIQEMSPDQIDKILERKSQAVTEGKRIWADIIYRWKNQTLEIDNDVVNGMAGLLLDGASDFDCYHVMELYKQTMGIPILAKKPTESDKTTRRRITPEESQAIEVAEAQRQEKMEDLPFVDENNQPLGEAALNGETAELAEELAEESSEVEEHEEEVEESFEDLFKHVVPGSEEMSFLQPTSKELTLLLNACFTMTQGTEGGMNYWKHMTLEDNEHRIKPDAFTFIQYFRLLRVSRSSKIAVRTLREQMVPAGIASGTAFHVALSVCRRDRKNHSVLLHANELVGLMRKAFIQPDIRVLDGYLEIYRNISADSSLLLGLRGLETEPNATFRRQSSKLRDVGTKLQALLRVNVLDTLRPYVTDLCQSMEKGKAEANTRWSHAQNQLADPIKGLAAATFMARVRLITDDALQPYNKKYLTKEQRGILSAESKMLKKFSDAGVRDSFKKVLIYPTSEQKEAARERIANYREECRVKELESKAEGSDEQMDSPRQNKIQAEA